MSAMSLAASLGKRDERILVILGPRGAGRNSLGYYVHHSRPDAGSFKEIDLDLFGDNIEIISGGGRYETVSPYLSYGATVMIDHAECDTGELLSAVEREARRIWGPSVIAPPMLIIGTSSLETARAWSRLLEAEIVELPSLAERKDDFFPLLQRFSQEAHRLIRGSKARFSLPFLEHISNLEWPGNVRQLRAVVIEALSLPDDDGALREGGEDENGSSSKLSRGQQALLKRFIGAKARWERYHRDSMTLPLPVIARRALEEASGNYRIAAARLGATVPALRATLSPPERVPAHDLERTVTG